MRCAKEAQPADVSGEPSRDTETSEDLSDNEIGTDGLDKLFQAGPVTATFQTDSDKWFAHTRELGCIGSCRCWEIIECLALSWRPTGILSMKLCCRAQCPVACPILETNFVNQSWIMMNHLKGIWRIRTFCYSFILLDPWLAKCPKDSFVDTLVEYLYTQPEAHLDLDCLPTNCCNCIYNFVSSNGCTIHEAFPMHGIHISHNNAWNLMWEETGAAFSCGQRCWCSSPTLAFFAHCKLADDPDLRQGGLPIDSGSGDPG